MGEIEGGVDCGEEGGERRGIGRKSGKQGEVEGLDGCGGVVRRGD